VEDKEGLQALQYADDNGMLYLHRACRDGASYERLQLLVKAYPQGCMVSDKQGKIPKDSLRENGAAARTDKDGMLLLHHACRDGVSVTLMLLFANAYPEGCSTKDNRGKLPSDYLKANGAAARSDDIGLYFLYHASGYGASVNLLKLLLDVYPDAINKVGNDGDLPLHHACYEDASLDVVKFLLEAYPEGAQIKDKEGCLPIHLACANYEVSVEVLKLLVDACQESLTVKDYNGKLPLDRAKANKKCTKAMRLMVSPVTKSTSRLSFNPKALLFSPAAPAPATSTM
jgi:ankyrin repeat protein